MDTNICLSNFYYLLIDELRHVVLETSNDGKVQLNNSLVFAIINKDNAVYEQEFVTTSVCLAQFMVWQTHVYITLIVFRQTGQLTFEFNPLAANNESNESS